MVTKKELSDFKQTLANALQKAGYTAHGRISSSREIYNFYAHLPEEEMVAQYAEDNNLEEINRIYRVIKYISENNGNYYSMKTLCTDNGIDYRIFAHAVENLPYINKTGEKRYTQYHWINDEEPSFSTAKNFIEHIRKLKLTKLNKSLKNKIKQAVAKGISKEEFFKTNKMRKSATLSADAYYNNQKMQQKRNAINGIPETFPEEIPQSESSNISEVELQDPGSPNQVSVLKDEDALTPSEILDDAGLQMDIYFLKQEIKYLKKINKAKDKLIKALRRKYNNISPN